MRPFAVLGVIALSFALGSITLGHGLLVPLIDDAELVDPNLARTLATPLIERSSECLLAATIILAMISRRWVARRFAGPLALSIAGLAAMDRFIVLPRLGQAWSRVDRVALRPVEQLESALRLESIHEWCLVTALLLLLILIGLITWRSDSRSAPNPV